MRVPVRLTSYSVRASPERQRMGVLARFVYRSTSTGDAWRRAHRGARPPSTVFRLGRGLAADHRALSRRRSTALVGGQARRRVSAMTGATARSTRPASLRVLHARLGVEREMAAPSPGYTVVVNHTDRRGQLRTA